jgi:hypothetical protein
VVVEDEKLDEMKREKEKQDEEEVWRRNGSDVASECASNI